MALNATGQLSFLAVSVGQRKCKHTFFDQVHKLMNGSLLEQE